MAVHVLFGKNGTGKTRYLKKIISDYIKEDKIIVTNLNNILSYGKIDMNKVQAMEDGVEPFDDYRSRVWDISMCDIELKKYAEMLLYEGDILILDEMDSFLSSQQIIDLCNIISDIEHLWKEIYLAGHTRYLLLSSLDLDIKLFYKDGTLEEIDRDDVCKYKDYM